MGLIVHTLKASAGITVVSMSPCYDGFLMVAYSTMRVWGNAYPRDQPDAVRPQYCHSNFFNFFFIDYLFYRKSSSDSTKLLLIIMIFTYLIILMT